MSDFKLPPELAALPKPAVIEDLDFDRIVEELVAVVVEEFRKVGVTYDIGHLEIDPAKIQIEAFAGREDGLRARINDAVRALLVVFARNSDLDHKVSELDVFRMPGEDDERLLQRYRLKSQSMGGGGSIPHYRRVVLEASLEVRDVRIWSEEDSPVLQVAVLSNGPDGVASEALLDTVRTALSDEGERVTSDRFHVFSAIKTIVDVVLEMIPAPGFLPSMFDDLDGTIKDAWIDQQDLLGLDLAHSWLISTARVSGISDVIPVSPAAKIKAAPGEAIAIGSVRLIWSKEDR